MKTLSILKNGLEAASDPITFWQKLWHPKLISFTFCKELKAFSATPEGQKISMIVDVGSNEGQFTFMARYCWKDAIIECFEPDPIAFEKLSSRYLRDGRINLHNLALSSKVGELTLNLGKDSAQNSFLMEYNKPCHEQILVRTNTLDNFYNCDTHSSYSPICLLKIDVQGYEMEVLKGASLFLRSNHYVLLEISLADLYEKGSKIEEVWRLLRESGYAYSQIIDQYRDRNSHKVIQMDVLFHRLQS